MDEPSNTIGRWLALFLLALPSLFFFVRGFQSPFRSRRLANFSLSCGLALLISPEATLKLSPLQYPELSVALGIIRGLLGLAGVGLGVAAFAKRRDGGIGATRPTFAIALGLMQVLMGAGLVTYSALNAPGTQWVYQSPGGDFRVTLPSANWKQATKLTSSAVVAFVSTSPQMHAGVSSVAHNQAKADFDKAAESFRRYIGNQPVKYREGNNAAGNPYCYWTGTETTPEGQKIFIAYSITWCPRKKLLIPIMFEGLFGAKSETMKLAEMELIEKSADTICLSVE